VYSNPSIALRIGTYFQGTLRAMKCLATGIIIVTKDHVHGWLYLVPQDNMASPTGSTVNSLVAPAQVMLKVPIQTLYVQCILVSLDELLQRIRDLSGNQPTAYSIALQSLVGFPGQGNFIQVMPKVSVQPVVIRGHVDKGDFKYHGISRHTRQR
jgi:hypothetical protein